MDAVHMEGQFKFLQDSQVEANRIGADGEVPSPKDDIEQATQRERELDEAEEIAETQAEETQEVEETQVEEPKVPEVVLDQPGEEDGGTSAKKGQTSVEEKEKQVKDGDDGKLKAAVKSRPKKTKRVEGTDQPTEVPEPPKPSDDLKDLPMITREAQQAQKAKKAKVSKMDGEAPEKGGKRSAPKAKADKPKRQRKADPSAEKEEVTETVEIEDDGEEEEGLELEGCRKDLSQDFEAAAETQPPKRRVSAAKAKAKSRQDKSKLEEKDKVKGKGKAADQEKGKGGKVADKEKGKGGKVADKEKGKGKVADKKKDKLTDKNKDKVADEHKEEVEPADDKPKGKSTFAGRYCPSENEEAIQRFNVIKKVFQESILPKVSGPTSSLEAGNGKQNPNHS